jgi:ectoine hydroxylase-related dioxygenase (phytanoyl-CoA dioxygenase family)
LLASFVTKKAKSLHGTLGLHPDYSLVDHSRHIGLNVWCPLLDVDHRNGCLCVVEGSHILGHIGSTPPATNPYHTVLGELESKYKTALPMTRGSAFLFDARLLHATGENITDSDRISLQFSMVPESATPLLYQWNDRQPKKLEVYEVDTDFLLRAPPHQYLEHAEQKGAKFLGLIDYNRQNLTVADLKRMLPRPASATTRISRLWSLIRS